MLLFYVKYAISEVDTSLILTMDKYMHVLKLFEPSIKMVGLENMHIIKLIFFSVNIRPNETAIKKLKILVLWKIEETTVDQEVDDIPRKLLV